MLDYLKSQFPRMNEKQIALIERVALLPEGQEPLPVERDRLSTIYLWLHMSEGSIRHRKFARPLK